MKREDIYQNTDFRVTIDQIGRLERALLSLRTSANGSPEVLDTIALIQYQELLRLRSELDAMLVSADEVSDLVMSLQGPYVELGTAPSSVIASMLTNIRSAVQSVSSYLITGQQARGGRFPDWISQPTDFQFVGLSSGSVRIRLNLPEPQTLFPEYGREPVERGVRLILDTISWIASDIPINSFEQRIQDEYLIRLLLTQVRRVVPTRNSVVQRVEFSGRLANPDNRYVLSPLSTNRIKYALKENSDGKIMVAEEGKLRSVDIDHRVFELRQRPDGKPDISCYISDEILHQALDFLVRDIPVIVEGVQEFDDLRKPVRLKVEDVYEKHIVV